MPENSSLNEAQLLKSVDVVVIPTICLFVAEKLFVGDSRARIAGFGTNFQGWFFGKVEELLPETQICYTQLTRPSLASQILAELGDKAEISLSHIYELIFRQSNGENGVLVNGWNSFYVRDISGVLRIVEVRWDNVSWGPVGWWLNAHSIDSPGRQDVNRRIFFRNI